MGICQSNTNVILLEIIKTQQIQSQALQKQMIDLMESKQKTDEAYLALEKETLAYRVKNEEVYLELEKNRIAQMELYNKTLCKSMIGKSTMNVTVEQDEGIQTISMTRNSSEEKKNVYAHMYC
jgi:hypothetical protein